jgi:hypothetical protein
MAGLTQGPQDFSQAMLTSKLGTGGCYDEKSRRENKNRDIVEIDTINSASKIAAIVGALLCVLVSSLDWHFTKTINFACWAINFGILSTLLGMKYLRLRRKHKLLITAVYLLFFIFFGYGYFFNLLCAV